MEISGSRPEPEEVTASTGTGVVAGSRLKVRYAVIALIPLALRGVRFRATGASSILRRNLLIYGVGGAIVPFIGIKLIDLIVTALGVS